MDHARKIGKTSDKFPWSFNNRRRCDTAGLVATDRPVVIEPPPEEDRRLANWKRWLADRERRQRYMCATLKRRPLDLALNAHERVREKIETRRLVEAAGKREITHQDKYRGNPAFWQVSERLKKCRSDDEEADDVVAKMDREAKNLPPNVTRVALADYIKREKMLVEPNFSGSKINLNTNWNCGDYLQKRTSELKKELQFIEPKKPETDDLVIVGRSFECGDVHEEYTRTPVITIVSEEPKKKLLNDPDERIALKIQNREFVLEKGRHFEKLSAEETAALEELNEDVNENKYAYAPLESDCVYKIINSKKAKAISWNLMFHSNGDERCERTLVFENRGVKTVSVDWRNVTPSFVPLQTIGDFSSCFFFNKNSVSILPGQKMEVPIWFHSKHRRVVSETWKILVEPKVYPGVLHVRLWATSNGDDLNERENEEFYCLRKCLKRRVRDTIVRETLQELILRATSRPYVDDIPYHLFFLEPDIFRAHNPGHFYHSIFVDELKAMYQSIKDDEDWSLCLRDLRSAILRGEDSNLRHENLLRFREISIQLLRPNTLYDRPSCSKRKLVYWILCAFFNGFEKESDDIACRCFGQCVDEDVESDNEGAASEKDKNMEVYREVFYVKIYWLLRETVDRFCAIMDSNDYY